MKKTLVIFGFLVAFVPSLTSAQTLTKADVEMVAPQIKTMLSTMGISVPAYVNARIKTQNSLIREYSRITSGYSMRISSGATLTDQEITEMTNTVRKISEDASLIAKWRADANVAISNMIMIVANISTLITSAR